MLKSLGWSNGIGGRQQLPTWARFFVDLGCYIFASSTSQDRTVALSIPTRGLAAAFLAAGVISEDYRIELARDDVAKFEALLALPKGATVRVTRRNRSKTQQILAVVDGFRIVEGRKLLRLQLSTSEWLSQPMSSAWALEPIDSLDWKPGAHVHHINWIEESHFLAAALAPLEVSQFTQPAGLDCTYVGNIAQFEREIAACELSALEGGERLRTGSLAEILRPEVAPYTHSARLALLSSSAKPRGARQVLKGVVLFDGARSFLRLGTQASGTRVVILDRSDPQFSEANERLREDYRRRSGDPVRIELPSPPGVDLVAFENGGIA
jgi:hypothetical protein